MDSRMIIVGAGHSGARAAFALRENGWDGAITLVGDEKVSPYDRPPLSKSVLLGERTVGECALYAEPEFQVAGIDLKLDSPVAAIDRGARIVSLRSGEKMEYRRMLLATGASPRRLHVPGSGLPGLLYLRTSYDATALLERLVLGQSLVIVGAGFIGMEIAATAVVKGCDVTIVESAPRALMRAVPQTVASDLVRLHQEKKVKFHFGTQVERISGSSCVESVHLDDGTVLKCNTVVVGIGVIPRDDLATAAGIDVADGIAVDDTLRTSDPHIYACGDVCSFPSRLFKRRMRLECWKNAEDQARIVARNMLGRGETYSEVPWFWSDQYDLTIQIAGVPAFGNSTATRVINETSRIVFAFDQEGVLVGASGIGQNSDIAKDVRIAQSLIGRRSRVGGDTLADPKTKLKALLMSESL